MREEGLPLPTLVVDKEVGRGDTPPEKEAAFTQWKLASFSFLFLIFELFVFLQVTRLASASKKVSVCFQNNLIKRQRKFSKSVLSFVLKRVLVVDATSENLFG
jgi:hypothetical protein